MRFPLRLLIPALVLFLGTAVLRADDDFPKVGVLYEMSFMKESTALKNIRVAAISSKNPMWIFVEELQFVPGPGGTQTVKVASRRWINLTFVVAANEVPFPPGVTP